MDSRGSQAATAQTASVEELAMRRGKTQEEGKMQGNEISYSP